MLRVLILLTILAIPAHAKAQTRLDMDGFPNLPRSWMPPGQEVKKPASPEQPSQPQSGNGNPASPPKPQQQGEKPASSVPNSGAFLLKSTPPSQSEVQKAREDYEKALSEKKQAQADRVHQQIMLEEKNKQIIKSQIEKFEKSIFEHQVNKALYTGAAFLGFFVLTVGLFVILRRQPARQNVHIHMSYAPPKFDTPPLKKHDKET